MTSLLTVGLKQILMEPASAHHCTGGPWPLPARADCVSQAEMGRGSASWETTLTYPWNMYRTILIIVAVLQLHVFI